MRMNTKFLGFSTVGRNKAPYLLSDQELIKQNLLNTLYTRRGERVMRPNYGTIIWDLLMDPLDGATEQLIRDDITAIISKEPRVELVDMIIITQDRAVRADITLKYIPYNNTDILHLTYNAAIESGEE
jgi:uncharacterized protein